MRTLAIVTCLAAMAVGPVSAAGAARQTVDVIEVDGRIDPVVAAFVTDTVRSAERGHSEALVIQLDSPGSVVSGRDLDVLVFRADAIKAQGKMSAGVDLALGLLLLAAGALLATGRLHGRRKAPVPAGDAQPGQPENKDGWAQRLLAEPRFGLAMLVGALIGIPGASYLTALHNLVTGKSSTATQVIAVIIFVIIDFLLIIIPFAFLELRPEATKALLRHSQDWLLGHALQLMTAIALLLGAYLAISGLVRLS